MALLLAGCGMAEKPEVRADGPVTVFAAASLTGAFTELAREAERAHPGLKVRLTFGASSQLRVQLLQGAPGDVFASADHEQMAPLVNQGVVEKPRVFARNRLVLVVPRANPGRIRSPRDLDRPGLRLVAAAPVVPVGRYTEAVLRKLAEQKGYPPDFPGRVMRNVASREPNVRAVLARVELGEADAALVYETDARSSRRVRSLPIPQAANVAAEYPIAVVRRPGGASRAGELVRFVLSDRGRSILKAHGFR